VMQIVTGSGSIDSFPELLEKSAICFCNSTIERGRDQTKGRHSLPCRPFDDGLIWLADI
jgi:hypothetical protein